MSELLNDKRAQSESILSLIGQHKKFRAVWNTLPDPTLKKLNIDVMISGAGTITLLCSSSVGLSYLRRQRKLLEKHLAPFMETEGLTELNITLKG